MLDTLLAIVLWATMLIGVASVATLAVNGPPLDIARLKTYRAITIGAGGVAVIYGIIEWIRDHPAYVVTGFATAVVMVGLGYVTYGQAWKAEQEDASYVYLPDETTEANPAAHRAD